MKLCDALKILVEVLTAIHGEEPVVHFGYGFVRVQKVGDYGMDLDVSQWMDLDVSQFPEDGLHLCPTSEELVVATEYAYGPHLRGHGLVRGQVTSAAVLEAHIRDLPRWIKEHRILSAI